MAQDIPLFGAQPPNPLFARYQGSNIPQLPPGYLESFQAAAQMRQKAEEFAISQQNDYDTKMAAVEQQKQQSLIESKKLDLQEKKDNNATKIDFLKAQSTIKSDTVKIYTSSLEAINSQFDSLTDSLSDPDLTEDQISVIKTQQARLRRSREVTVGKIQELTGIDTEEEDAPLNVSRYVQPGVPQSRPPEQRTTKRPIPTKEVIQVDQPDGTSSTLNIRNNRLESTIDKDGNEKVVDGNYTKEDVAATFAANKALAESVNAPVANARVVSKSYQGPLNTDVEEFSPTMGLSGKKVNSTIFQVKDSSGKPTGKWKVGFPSAMQGPEAEDAKRFLTGMTYVLNGGYEIGVEATEEDEQFVKENFGISGINDSVLSKVAKAKALWTRMSGDVPYAEFTAQDLAIDRAFNDKYKMSIAEFQLSGETSGGKVTLDYSENKASEERNALAYRNMVKTAEAASPGLDTGEKENVDRIKKELDENNRQLELLKKPATSESGRKTQDAKRRALETRNTQINTDIRMMQFNSDRRKSIAEELKTSFERNNTIFKAEGERLANRTTKGNLSVQASKLAERFPGALPGDIERFDGAVAIGLENINNVVKPVYNQKTKKMEEIHLSPYAAIQYMASNGDIDNLSIAARGMPSEDNVKKVLEGKQRFHDAILPMQELHKLAKELASGNWTDSKIKQLFDDETNTVNIYRQSLIGAMRVAIVGPGNPSNYEQELLQEMVPDLQSLYGVDNRKLKRLEKLALLSVISNANNLNANGMKVTQSTIDIYNNTMGEAIGKKLTLEQVQRLQGILSTQKKVFDTAGASLKSREYAKELFKSEVNKILGI